MPGWKKDGLSTRGASDIRCPFYRAHSNREILCESHVPDSRILIKFDSEKIKSQQQHIYCEGNYKRCEHYLSVKHFRWEDE